MNGPFGGILVSSITKSHVARGAVGKLIELIFLIVYSVKIQFSHKQVQLTPEGIVKKKKIKIMNGHSLRKKSRNVLSVWSKTITMRQWKADSTLHWYSRYYYSRTWCMRRLQYEWMIHSNFCSVSNYCPCFCQEKNNFVPSQRKQVPFVSTTIGRRVIYDVCSKVISIFRGIGSRYNWVSRPKHWKEKI